MATLGLRGATARARLSHDRRQAEIHQAMVASATASGEHLRTLVNDFGPRAPRPLPFAHRVLPRSGDADMSVLRAAMRTRSALRGSPDPDQVASVDAHRVGWAIPGNDPMDALVVCPWTALLDYTLDGHAAGLWRRVESPTEASVSLPPPFPPTTHIEPTPGLVHALADEADTTRRRLLIPPLYLALLVLVGAGLAAATWRRESIVRKRRDAFLSAVTHELKTPIANIQLHAETLDRIRDEDPAQARSSARIIRTQAARLDRRVQQLLDVATGIRTSLSAAPFDVVEAVQRVVTTRQDLGETITWDPPSGTVQAKGPRRLFERALTEVLDNAAAFAPDGPTEVTMVADAATVAITVRDHGPGIPAREREAVLAPFVRLGDPLTNPVPGTGLGLALVRQAVVACGGRVSLNDADGDGLSITLHLLRAT